MIKRGLFDLSIGQRVSLGFGAAGALLAALVLMTHLWTRQIIEVRARQVSVLGPRTTAAEHLETSVLRMGLVTRTYVLFPDPPKREAFERGAREVRERLGVLTRLPKDPDGDPVVARLPGLVDAYLSSAQALVGHGEDVEARALEAKMASAREALIEAVSAYVGLQERKLEEGRAEIAATVDRVNVAAKSFGGFALVLLAIVGLLTTSVVRRPALELVNAARRLAAGDYDPALGLMHPAQTEPLRDELAELSRCFRQMAHELKAREDLLQEKNEVLQAQNEEIQAQNEEIQAQHEEIQEQNEELQSHVEQLQAQGEELAAQSDELQRTVQRLTEREETLREVDRNKNEFLAMLSHELRNPLAPIKSSLYILDHVAPGTEPARRALTVIDRQVHQLSRLVGDLLDVTRISRGKVQLQKGPVELGKLVRQTAEDHALEFSKRGIELDVQIAADPWLDGDATRLSQAVGNLLQNAAKFTPRGGRVVLRVEASDGRARIWVRDTGTGMDDETLKRVFQPFMQGDVTLARTNGGLGLGLALVRGLVELHGGAVSASSGGRGQGSEFLVELPAGTAQAVPVTMQPVALRLPRRVLVIEDNVDAADSLREALSLSGHSVEVANRGVEGIAKARGWAPEVVLCDIGLPDMDGLAVARAFRGDPQLSNVFLVALTGYAQPEDRQRASEAGFDEHLAKPPSLDGLEELLARVPPRARA